MAKSMAQGLRDKKSWHLSASSPSLSNAAHLDGVKTHPNNLAHLDKADVIIIAVKPAKVSQVLNEIKSDIPSHCVVVSIAAGISLGTLSTLCRSKQAIIRSMPNTPMAVGQGATPLIANEFVSSEQKQIVETLFQCSGITTWVTHENEINLYTALSGSGPAYLFLFMEAMISAAQQLGLPADQAQAFTLQTCRGAVSLLENTGLTPEELRKKVTSPAGTTAAAIAILQHQGFESLIFKAMQSAYERAIELDNPIKS
jgi:pyrroline-5-carboxylate reductase